MDLYGKYLHVRSAEEKKARRRKILRRNVIATAMASPPFIGFLCFTAVPMIMSLVISFTELHSYNLSLAKFIGIRNYVEVIKSEMLWTSILNTLYYCLSVPINICVSLFLANVLTRKIFCGKIARIILFVPQVCSSVAVTLMWQWIFEDNYGVINTVLTAMGLPKIAFMTDKNWFMPAVLTISLWQNGTNVVLLQAAFVNINKSLQEAARIDGANERKVFWRVTLPGLTPTLFYMLTMNLIAALQEQTVMQIITTNGVGPGYRALTLVYYIYRMAFTYTATMGMGMACALSWIVAIFILIVTRINFRLGQKWVCYD
ncbi:MAG TPA: hypothetical protein DIV38_03615 [Clostridiales bacterium]|nr:hypothetical protein [Clostridiales bacterium]